MSKVTSAKAAVHELEQQQALRDRKQKEALQNVLASKHNTVQTLDTNHSRHPVFQFVRTCFESKVYEGAMAMFVAVNVVLLIIETDCGGLDKAVPPWTEAMNNVFLGGFCCELVAKFATYGREFFHSPLNVIDLVVVGSDAFLFALRSVWDHKPTLSIIRIVRLVRVGRSVDFLMLFPELGLMLSALAGTIKSIAWGCILLANCLVIFSILAVQIIHPINKEVAAKGVYTRAGCERCPHAFETVWDSLLTLFQQLIAGDSWGQVCLPICEESALAFVFFALALGGLQMLVTNVILAAVLNAAEQARRGNMELLEKEKESDRRENQKELVKLCSELDKDGSGELTFDELLDGFTHNISFARNMEAMDVEANELEAVWSILDADGGGTVDYTEFADQLYKMKNNDTHTLIVFIKFYVLEIRNKILEDSRTLRQTVFDRMGSLSDFISGKLTALPQSPSTDARGVLQNTLANQVVEEKENAFIQGPVDMLEFHKFKEDLMAQLFDRTGRIENKLEALHSAYSPAPNGVRAPVSGNHIVAMRQLHGHTPRDKLPSYGWCGNLDKQNPIVIDGPSANSNASMPLAAAGPSPCASATKPSAIHGPAVSNSAIVTHS